MSLLCTSFEHWIHLINMTNHLSVWCDILATLDHQSCCGEKKYFLLMAIPSLLPFGTAGLSMDRGRGHHLWLSVIPWMRLPGFQVLTRNYEWAGLWISLGKLDDNSLILRLCIDPVPVVCVLTHSLFFLKWQLQDLVGQAAAAGINLLSSYEAGIFMMQLCAQQ